MHMSCVTGVHCHEVIVSDTFKHYSIHSFRSKMHVKWACYICSNLLTLVVINTGKIFSSTGPPTPCAHICPSPLAHCGTRIGMAHVPAPCLRLDMKLNSERTLRHTTSMARSMSAGRGKTTYLTIRCDTRIESYRIWV